MSDAAPTREAHPTRDTFTADATARELQIAFDHTMTGIAWLNTHGVFEEVRAGYAQLLGYTADEMLGLSWHVSVAPEDHEAAGAAVRQMLEQGRAEIRLRALRKDGTQFHKRILLVKTADASGAYNGHYCFMRDVSDRQAVEDALRHSRRFSERLLEVIQDGVAVVDAQGRHIKVNEALTRMTGFSRDELVGSGLPHLYWPEEHTDAITDLFHAVPHGGAQLETIFCRKNGQRFPVIVSPATTVDNQGNTIHIATVKDVSELKEAQRRLIEAERLKTMGTLAGGIAHDLNNLLTPILGYADAVLKGLLDVDDAARAIRDAASSAQGLISGVLQFSRNEAAGPAVTSVTEAVKIAVQFARTSLPTNVAMRMQLESVRDVVACTEPDMQQVVMNLVSNAGHAMRKSGGTLTIRVFNPARDRVALAVRDTGPGIAKRQMPRIFEPFYTTRSAGEGTGLGLATVKRVVTAMGGSVTVDSQLAAGACFTIELPLVQAGTGRPAPRPVREEPAPEAALHILLIDDQSGVLKVTGSMLEHLGHRVTAYTDPGEALTRGVADVDLILTDYRMEGMTGLDFVERSGRTDLPVVLMSGDRDNIDPMPQWVDARLDKPFTLADLRAAIGAATAATVQTAASS